MGLPLRVFRRNKLVKSVTGFDMIKQDITRKIIGVNMSLWMSMRQRTNFRKMMVMIEHPK